MVRRKVVYRITGARAHSQVETTGKLLGVRKDDFVDFKHRRHKYHTEHDHSKDGDRHPSAEAIGKRVGNRHAKHRC